MNKLKARNGRVYCDMCNQSFLDEAACEPFLKDGETVVDCIKRNQNDVSMVLRLLAKEKARVAELTSLLMEAVNEMEPDIEAKYEAADVLAYPSMARKYEQDMDLPRRIRAAIAGKEGE